MALELEPSADLQLVRQRLEQTEEAMELLRFGEPAFLSFLKQVDNCLAKARVAGVLMPGELMDIYHLLRASRLAVSYTDRPSAARLKQVTAGIRENGDLERKIFAAVDEDGVRDDASPTLHSIRKQIETLRLKIKDYLQNFIRSGNNQNLLQDALVTERSGRYVVPVKQEYRQAVKGIVHDESASGATVFIEPLAVVENNNKIRSLQAEEKRELERILKELSYSVGVYADELQYNSRLLADLDLIFARAHLAYKMNAFPPELNNQGIIEINRAKHPLLGENAVPVNIRLGQDFDILVITGPNTGGKTVVLKTIGLLTVMAMCGLFIPAREKSKIALFKHIYIDIGDEQSIEQSLSTFSSHMGNIINILQQVDGDSLVLMDELGAGTDPYEGAALARAVLEEMKRKNARVVVTTHQSELKTFAYQNQRVENACVEFDPRSLMPTYELTIGTPGQSNAFEIAARLGLKRDLVERAQNLVPQREMELGNMIRQLKESRYSYDASAKELEEEKRRIAQEKQAFAEEKKRFQEEKNAALIKARQEADSYVRNIKREANEAIEELKGLIKEQNQPPKWHEVEKRMKTIKELSVNLTDDEEDWPEHEARPGDYVMIKNINQKGYVLERPNAQGEILVQVGIMRLSVKKDQVAPAQAAEDKISRQRQQSFLDKVKDISPELDLRGQYALDAITILDKYLEDAHLAGLDKARIIHGKGTGTLRKAVREHIKNHRYVEQFRDGLNQEGGYGVTIVELN